MVQLSGESREDAIVNHFSLDIEEQDKFFAYIENMGYSIDDSDEIIDNLYAMWNENERK